MKPCKHPTKKFIGCFFSLVFCTGKWPRGRRHTANLSVVGSNPNLPLTTQIGRWLKSPAFQVGHSGLNPDALIHHGELTEWLIATILKTAGVGMSFEGSNPSLSAYGGVAQLEERRSPKPCLLHVRVVPPLFIADWIDDPPVRTAT